MSLGDQHGSHSINLIDFYMAFINILVAVIPYRSAGRRRAKRVTSQSEISEKQKGVEGL
jgi:hypothetical protein